MKQLSELSKEELAKRIETNCDRKLAELWRGKDFADVTEQAKMPGTVLLMMLVVIREGRLEGMSDETKEKFRARRDEFKTMSEDFEKSFTHLTRHALSVPDMLAARQLRGMAERASKGSLAITPFLKKQGQKDGVDLLVRVILDRNKSFDCWAALSRVFETAAGKRITTSALRMKRDRYLQTREARAANIAFLRQWLRDELAMRTEKEK